MLLKGSSTIILCTLNAYSGVPDNRAGWNFDKK